MSRLRFCHWKPVGIWLVPDGPPNSMAINVLNEIQATANHALAGDELIVIDGLALIKAVCLLKYKQERSCTFQFVLIIFAISSWGFSIST